MLKRLCFLVAPEIKFGLAPLTSMFLTGENDHRVRDGFRAELHDSDGLLMLTSANEWIWRPLANPAFERTSSFLDRGVKGFGLMQRDRTFESYQDLELGYESRPSYFVEPKGDWGSGRRRTDTNYPVLTRPMTISSRAGFLQRR